MLLLLLVSRVFINFFLLSLLWVFDALSVVVAVNSISFSL